MKSRLYLVLTVFLMSKAIGQNADSLKVDISYKLFSKCFKNLNYGSEVIENYPALKKSGLCSIQDCILSLAYNEEIINKIVEVRLIGIATQLFREGNPVLLISGMNSYATSLEENENTEDDNKIIYISVGECVIPNYISKGTEIFNKQTLSLIEKKKNGL
ncbi:hypothetical protein SAMN05444377_11760 [Flavobacterium fontis]|uniref:Tissue inhibitor of metalloproteinase n=1 Tax=Flavobacterium fontis TaxID=1124188 RepID=A0A1M5E4H5_9FLAO|nr:hypothetical protein [Flavobacterium fontis]SHF74095.1 hypothetical protein SAMN05444377_11760 [Flavobacterium fontis]